MLLVELVELSLDQLAFTVKDGNSCLVRGFNYVLLEVQCFIFDLDLDFIKLDNGGLRSGRHFLSHLLGLLLLLDGSDLLVVFLEDFSDFLLELFFV